MNKILNRLLSNDENILSADEIVTFSENGSIFINGTEVSKSEFLDLKEEARMIKESKLFSLIKKYLIADSIERGMTKSKDWEEVLTAKSTLYVTSIFDKIINKIISTK